MPPPPALDTFASPEICAFIPLYFVDILVFWLLHDTDFPCSSVSSYQKILTSMLLLRKYYQKKKTCLLRIAYIYE